MRLRRIALPTLRETLIPSRHSPQAFGAACTRSGPTAFDDLVANTRAKSRLRLRRSDRGKQNRRLGWVMVRGPDAPQAARRCKP